MTSQIRSRIKYLTASNTILVRTRIKMCKKAVYIQIWF